MPFFGSGRLGIQGRLLGVFGSAFLIRLLLRLLLLVQEGTLGATKRQTFTESTLGESFGSTKSQVSRATTKLLRAILCRLRLGDCKFDLFLGSSHLLHDMVLLIFLHLLFQDVLELSSPHASPCWLLLRRTPVISSLSPLASHFLLRNLLTYRSDFLVSLNSFLSLLLFLFCVVSKFFFMDRVLAHVQLFFGVLLEGLLGLLEAAVQLLSRRELPSFADETLLLWHCYETVLVLQSGLRRCSPILRSRLLFL